ncbi:MAG: hypothetical protein WC675_05950 [Patescibacteria group bacterium]|jgi:glutathione synthase/RimK-type ligase-like ATP-grasp enzyme
MKIYILHHDLEPAEEAMKELFASKNIDTELIDIRDAKLACFKGSCLVLNRVYASVANRDYPSILKTLNLLKELEANNYYCLNSYKTSLFDYDKFESFKVMKDDGVYTPETFFIDNLDGVNSFLGSTAGSFGPPFIVKRNTGGRGKDVSKVNSLDGLYLDLEDKFNRAEKEGYRGGFIVQEFVKPERDCRIGIIDGSFAFSYKRTLISKSEDDSPWLCSVCSGSEEHEYDANEDEIRTALKASRSIGADFNELDLIHTDKGPCVIENNPTPGYLISDTRDKERMERFVEAIIKNLLNHSY